jgi:membrane-associated PAP2 superfamily phosphatase
MSLYLRIGALMGIARAMNSAHFIWNQAINCLIVALLIVLSEA